ncbi:MAG: hypothetical protein EOP04_23925 [Proteobacteria bacterium]|nr:MAG: hypothetical protein EOP04_23925 [Pseudomonadota bacterium]
MTWYALFILKEIMRLTLTADQFKRLLQKSDTKPKYPITLDLKKISKAEAQEIIDLLKKKKG